MKYEHYLHFSIIIAMIQHVSIKMYDMTMIEKLNQCHMRKKMSRLVVFWMHNSYDTILSFMNIMIQIWNWRWKIDSSTIFPFKHNNLTIILINNWIPHHLSTDLLTCTDGALGYLCVINCNLVKNYTEIQVVSYMIFHY